MESKQKGTRGGITLIRTLVVKAINNERNILTYHKITDHI